MSFLLLQIDFPERESFVQFWASQYRYKEEHLYLENIGKPLTQKRVLRLFEWKNGRKLSVRKISSIKSNFLPRNERLPLDFGLAFLRAYLLRPGGTIWRIFWLHLQRPDQYPIFDQHVYRAMAKLRGLPFPEIPMTDEGKVDSYLSEYLPFWKEVGRLEPRNVDRALHAFGKFLSRGYPLSVTPGCKDFSAASS